MKGIDLKNPRESFKFLDEKTANEPHVFEVLNEILLYQMSSLPSGDKPLANMDVLKKSSKIKIPFTTTRDRTIEYLMDILTRRYAHFVRPIISFEFRVEENTKKIDIIETTEYTVLLNNKDFEDLLATRDRKTIDNLLDLLKKYRFFNLSKLIKKAQEKAELSRIIKQELGRKIFTFKNYNIDDNKIEWAEDFCFHIDNYESVRDSLNLNTLKEIITLYSDSVRRGLNKFGIINPDFSDYRDSKLAYIFSVLTDDMASTIAEKDLVDIKNLHSLVSCLNKVDKVVDPILIVNEDIIKFIRDHKITTEAEIIGSMPELNNETLRKWASQENLKQNKIVLFNSPEGERFFIDGLSFFDMISEYNQLILYQPEKMNALSHTEKRKVNSKMEVLASASINMFKSGEKIQEYIRINNEKLQTLKKILNEYDKYNKKIVSGKEQVQTQTLAPETRKKRSFFGSLLNFFKSLFRFYARGNIEDSKSEKNREKILKKKELSHETTKIYRKTIDRNAPVIPISDFVELSAENDYLVDRIIKEMRDNNLKIVIPIYNARKNLYPKRSQKLLIPDVEYLLVSPERIKSPDTIREFTDSLVGYKIKDELIPATGIIAIEKYLLTLYRQHKTVR
ncbi:MAG: hypothetical protein JW864_04185 [Spirochaetes bacterium]|nr:hypothetical protein [Spirochaetota bacterium]